MRIDIYLAHLAVEPERPEKMTVPRPKAFRKTEGQLNDHPYVFGAFCRGTEGREKDSPKATGFWKERWPSE